MLPLLGGHDIFVVLPDVLGRRHQEAGGTAGWVADGVVRGGLHKFHHHLDDMAGRAELAVLACGGQLAQHILVQVALHIQAGDIVLIQIIQPGDDLLQHLRRRDQEQGIAHVSGKGGSFAVVFSLFLQFFLGLGLALFSGLASLGCAVRGTAGNGDQLAGFFVKVWQLAVPHLLQARKDPLGNNLVNLTGVAIFEFTPPHGLTNSRLWENFRHFLAGHILKGFSLLLFFIQGADEHQISQLLDDRQGIGDAARPDVRPDFIDFIFDCACNHAFSSKRYFYPVILFKYKPYPLKTQTEFPKIHSNDSRFSRDLVFYCNAGAESGVVGLAIFR